MHFPSFAGGKFIVNCLSLSKHSLVMNGQSVDYLISNPTDYEYRLNEVLSTLPLPENILDWLVTCEFGDDVMYGLDYWKKCSVGLIVEPTDRVLQIANSNMLFFMTVHDIESILGIMNNWKDAFVISLINHVKFQTLSHSLKAVDRIIDNGNVSENHPLISLTLFGTSGILPFKLNTSGPYPPLHISGNPSKLSNP